MMKSIVARMTVAEVSDPAMLLILLVIYRGCPGGWGVHLKDRFGYGIDFFHAMAHKRAEHVHLLTRWIFLISFSTTSSAILQSSMVSKQTQLSENQKKKYQPYKSSRSKLIFGRGQNHFPDKRNVKENFL